MFMIPLRTQQNRTHVTNMVSVTLFRV